MSVRAVLGHVLTVTKYRESDSHGCATPVPLGPRGTVWECPDCGRKFAATWRWVEQERVAS